MKTLFYIFFVLLIISLNFCKEKPITIHMIGDSTMANKPDPEINPERGWGQMLQLFFDDNVIIKNHAVNGRSTKSFIDEGLWDSVMVDINQGDYVFIQFGHNDKKTYDPHRYANPITIYRKNLETFVNKTREKGAIPVLITSIVRRKFNKDSVLEDTHGLYPFITHQVAYEKNVYFIDLQLKTEELVTKLGPEKSKKMYLWIKADSSGYFPEGKQDNTHLTIFGAKEVCRLATENIKELKMPLTDYIK
ncbi:rhamnogalacturonan acetylesterase [Bacteroidota bacterium]